jgi:hypothetical protein
MFVAEGFNAFQLHDDFIFDNDVAQVFTDTLTLIHDWKSYLGLSVEADRCQFLEERPLVDLLKESGP